MRFGPSVALAPCWVGPILLLLLLILLPLLILQIYNMPWPFALSFALLRESCVFVARRFASVSATASLLRLFCFQFLSLLPRSFSIIALENLLAVNLAILPCRGSFFLFVNSRGRHRSASRDDDPRFASVDFLFFPV